MANPQIEFWQLDNVTDPSGTRDLGLAGDGFVKRLDTSTSGHLNFGNLNITTSGVFAGTKPCFFRVSNLGTSSQVFNFRFYISSLSAWGTGNYSFKYNGQVAFEAGKALDVSSSGMPLSLPDSQNIFSTQQDTFIQAVAESGCSQYVYLDMFADTDVPVGVYGGPGNGGFRYRLTYDFS
jgi:hypothetical protein